MSVVGKGSLAAVASLAAAAVQGLSAAAHAKAPTRSDPCDLSTGTGSPASNGEALPLELSSPFEAAILERFGVLRRAALPSDRFPALSPVGIQLDSQLVSFFPAYVRQVKTTPKGGRYFLIPGFARAHVIPPVNCLPASLRRDRPELVEQEQKLASEPVYCIVDVGHEGAGSECGWFAQIEESPLLFAPSLSNEEPIVELVPDGVASVRATYRIGAPVVAKTAENVYTLVASRAVLRRERRLAQEIASRTEHEEHEDHHSRAEQRRLSEAALKAIEKVAAEATPVKLEWLGSAGEVVRSIAPPSAASAFLAAGAPIDLEG
jgi:hypothetical protein